MPLGKGKGGGRRSSAGGRLTLIRTQSAEDRRRAAAARREVRKEAVEQRALSAELSAVQRELTACKQTGAAPTAAGFFRSDFLLPMFS